VGSFWMIVVFDYKSYLNSVSVLLRPCNAPHFRLWLLV